MYRCCRQLRAFFRFHRCKRGADVLFCHVGLGDVVPFSRRVRGRLRDYLDHVAIVQRRLKRDHFAVYARARHFVAEVRVDRIREIYRGCCYWQVDDVSFRGKHEHAVTEKIGLEGVEVFFRPLPAAMRMREFLNPVGNVVLIRVYG